MPYVINREDIAWAAGLFEGEGCIKIASKKSPYIRIELLSQDEDVVRRFAAVFGAKVNGPYGPKQHAKRPHFRVSINGFEFVQAVLTMMWPWLGERRRARFAEGINTSPISTYKRRIVRSAFQEG